MIIRVEKNKNYTVLSNAVLLDDTISDKARGVLVRLLCRPDNWNLNVKHLVRTGKDGNASIRSAIRELENAGYIRKEITRHENGRIIGIEYTVCESKDAATLDVVEPAPINNDDRVSKTVMLSPVKTACAPITNTDNKQILKETTTTAPVPEPEQSTQGAPDQLVASSSCSSQILNLIPEQHQSPVVLTLVNKAMVEYSENEIKQALAYAGANVRGGSLQFRAYLDKTLKNGWADGWEPAQDTQAGKHAAREHFGAMPDSSLRMLAGVGNLVALEELKRRESRVGHVGTC